MDKMKVMKVVFSLLCMFSMIGSVYASDVQDNQYFGYRKESSSQRQKATKIQAQDQFIYENRELKLYVNEKSLGIKVENKKTGYIWGSVLEEEDESLNKTWLGMAQSGISIEYMDEKLKSKTVSMSNSRVQSQIQKIDKGFEAIVNWKQLGFQIKMSVELQGQQLLINIVHDDIQENSQKNKLQSLYIYPFLGFTKNQEIDGYMFVPDGCGALIRLNEKNVAAISPYQARVYGEDYGVAGTSDSVEALSQVSQIYMPVYGMAHGHLKDAYLAHILKGEEYAMIQATPAGVTTSYNWITSKFILRDSYFKYVNKQKKGFVTVPEQMNVFDIQMRYDFLSQDNASYIGMAKSYQNQLVQQGVLQPTQKQDIGMQLEILMSEKKKGLFFDQTIEMTTSNQLQEILDDLQNNIPLFQVNLRGYGKLGAQRQVGKHTNFEGAVLTYQQFNDLQDLFPEIHMSLYTDYMRKYKGWFGYGNALENALSLNEQLLQFRNHDDIYVAPETVVKNYRDEMNDLDTDYINMENVGKLLYSHHNDDNAMNRKEVKESYIDMLKQAKQTIGVYGGNAYLWQYIDAIYENDMTSSHYFLFSEDVPFMQIVLKGYKDYYASPLNMTASSKELLKMVEYGNLPSYLLTYEDSKKLMKTESQWIYSSQYESLKERLQKQYHFIYNGLKAQMNATIVDREVLEQQVVKMTYSNQKSIIINYSQNPYTYQGITIAKESYKVMNDE